MTGVERLRAATAELQAALVQARAETPQPPNGNLDALADWLGDATHEFAVVRPLLSVIDTIHVLRQEDRWYDVAFRKVGIVTKNTNSYKFPGEKDND